MRLLSIVCLALAACSAGEARTTPSATTNTPRAEGTAATALRAAAGANDTSLQTPRPATRDPQPAIVRALYVNRWAAQSPKRMRGMIAIADSTEINALVIDMKDEFGLNFESKDTLVSRNAGNAGRVPKLASLLDRLRAHHILAIARIVTFKDSVAARVNPQHTIRKPDGTPWRDKKGLTWVDPYDHAIWEYNIRVAEELARMGFGEIQFDYIRFPEPYPSLPRQVFRDASGTPKPVALAKFLGVACPRIHALGALCTADIFGLVTTVPGALEVGQEWEKLSPVTDVLLPMVYPSHYPHGAFGIPRPNADPYRTVNIAIARAHERDKKLGIASQGHVRAWLQAFTLGKPEYGPEQIRAQKKAVYDAGYTGWVLWNPGSRYGVFEAALDRKIEAGAETPPGS